MAYNNQRVASVSWPQELWDQLLSYHQSMGTSRSLADTIRELVQVALAGHADDADRQAARLVAYNDAMRFVRRELSKSLVQIAADMGLTVSNRQLGGFD